MKLSKQDKEAIADRDWWNELSKYLPWRVAAWTRRDRATIFTLNGGVLELSGSERDEIIEAFTGRGERVEPDFDSAREDELVAPLHQRDVDTLLVKARDGLAKTGFREILEREQLVQFTLGDREQSDLTLAAFCVSFLVIGMILGAALSHWIWRPMK